MFVIFLVYLALLLIMFLLLTFLYFFSELEIYINSEISFLLGKFACFNLAAKVSNVNLLNSRIVIYLP